MPFDNPKQIDQDNMIYKASLEELEYFKEYPERSFLTEESIKLINERIKELKESKTD